MAKAGSNSGHYLPGRLIVKLEAGNDTSNIDSQNSDRIVSSIAYNSITSYLKPFGLQKITPVFDLTASERVKRLMKERPGSSMAAIETAESLQRTFSIIYGSGDSPELLAAELERLPGVVYAEPHYTHITGDEYDIEISSSNAGAPIHAGEKAHSKHIPDDPFIGQDTHNYFNYLNFYRAWGITKGSPDVIIAIVDTGVFYNHPDLKENLWHNPTPGSANDYFPEFEIVNDTIGWNFWESGDIFRGEDPVQNANPTGNFSTHGTRVAGISAAVTDNGIGIAGAGFRTRFMPVKVGGTREYPNRLAYANHGILYAAINGADVINCSFTGTGTSEFARDVLKFAREMGAVVVAAMGNNGVSTTSSYPAVMDDVIAVGAVTHELNDNIAGFSNYGYMMDVFAVGQNMISTSFSYNEALDQWTPAYHTSNGTSLSTPVVSGLAALLKSKNPDWPQEQITNQIRATARSIEMANPDPKFRDKLGYGVIDAYATLTQQVSALSINNHQFRNELGNKISVGESGILTIYGTHFGRPSPQLTFNLEPLQQGMNLQHPQKTISDLGPGETFKLNFDLYVDENYMLDSVPIFRLSWSAEQMSDQIYEGSYIIVYDELLYGDIDINRLKLSIPSDGTIGFMEPSDKSIGHGFIPEGYDNIIRESGLMIGASISNERVIINQVRDSTGITRHFRPVANFRYRDDSQMQNAQSGYALFRSEYHPADIDLDIKLTAMALDEQQVSQTALLAYQVLNSSSNTYEDVLVGIFTDWELQDEGIHHVTLSNENNILMVSHDRGPPVAGITVFSNISGALAINNESFMTLDQASSMADSLGFGIRYDPDNDRLDGFTDAEKKLSLTSGMNITSISAHDVSTVIATGPYTLYPHSKITIGFAYVWGFTHQQIENQVRSLKERNLLDFDDPGEYSRDGILAEELTLYPSYPNPFSSRTNIRFDVMKSTQVELAVYDLLGRRVATLVNDILERGPHFVTFDGRGMASGIYITVLNSDDTQKWKMMTLIR